MINFVYIFSQVTIY